MVAGDARVDGVRLARANHAERTPTDVRNVGRATTRGAAALRTNLAGGTEVVMFRADGFGWGTSELPHAKSTERRGQGAQGRLRSRSHVVRSTDHAARVGQSSQRLRAVRDGCLRATSAAARGLRYFCGVFRQFLGSDDRFGSRLDRPPAIPREHRAVRTERITERRELQCGGCLRE
jgi:hypothetical protein